jgi:hypothetical protein
VASSEEENMETGLDVFAVQEPLQLWQNGYTQSIQHLKKT